MQSESRFVLENVYFGNEVIQMYQLPSLSFNEACMSKKDGDNNDNTGLRIYLGCFCCIRLLQSENIKSLLLNKNVLELGAGAGALSLIGLRNIGVMSITITDGNQSAVDLAKMNLELMQSISKCQVHLLSWNENNDDFVKYNNNKKFDVVIASDLMYYSTDVTELIRTVLLLTDGLFIHAHVFRRDGQKAEIIELLKKNGWSTLQIPIISFANSSELREHPDWYSTTCLLSASEVLITKLLNDNMDWALFQEDEDNAETFNFSDFFE